MENSTPIAPEPITITDFGSFSCRIASRYVTTFSPSTFQAPGTATLAPVATMMFLALSSVVLPSLSLTEIVVGFGQARLSHEDCDVILLHQETDTLDQTIRYLA